VNMPFHGHHSSSSSSAQQNAQHMPPSAASGIFQAAQALGSIGAPTGNLRTVTLGTTSAGTDSLYPSGTSMTTSNPGGQSAPPTSYNISQSNSGSIISPPNSATNNSQQDDPPRRPQAYNRQSDELHLSTLPGGGQRGQISTRDYTASGPPRISLEQAVSDANQYQRTGQMPGALQPGGPNRPGAVSSNTAPAMPTIGQSLSQDPYSTPARTGTHGHSHNYSRSSPSAGGYDGQNYIPFSTTPGGTEQYSSPINQKYTPVNQRNISNTPLGLADIRPRADSGVSDNLPGANPYSYDGANAQPTNSNYLAPWAIYAFDWCKWPAQNSDAGKVAVGSYLEDGHNFVRRFLMGIVEYG
jgi:DDB1- and CUL4-associated factor 7